MAYTLSVFVFVSLVPLPVLSDEARRLDVIWPPAGASIPLAADHEGPIGVVVSSNFKLMPAGRCPSQPADTA